MRIARVQIWFILLVILCAGRPALAGDIYLSVALSLKLPVDELADRFARLHPGVRFVRNYGSSGTLAHQLESGAPTDIFITSNVPWMNDMNSKSLISTRSIADFTYNTLVVVGPPGTKVSSLKDLLKLKRIAIGNPKSVAVGQYAMEAFRQAFIDKELEKKLVLAKDTRECRMYAERGVVDGAVMFRTDALQGEKIKILFAVPQNLYSRVVYPIALTANGARNVEAQAFYRYLLGAEAQGVLAKYGFPPR